MLLALERIVAGAEPACRLSRRAEAALGQIGDRLPFVDGETLPVVSYGDDKVVVRAFDGGAATASIAAGLAREGIRIVSFTILPSPYTSGIRARLQGLCAVLIQSQSIQSCPMISDRHSNLVSAYLNELLKAFFEPEPAIRPALPQLAVNIRS
jgi:hypothetical protein